MECEFVVNGIEEEPERRSAIVRTGWESVVFEVEDLPDDGDD